MDARDFGICQGFVLPAPEARTHRTLIVCKRRRAQRDPRRTTPATAAFFLDLDLSSHIRTLSDLGS
jgi:hypothetical protein